MADELFTLFDEFAARYARGERPDARDYLARAGDRRDELARMLDRFVTLCPPPEPDQEAVEAMRAWLAGEPPLKHLRTERRVTRDQVVDALVGGLDIDPGKHGKVAEYYHELESGLLEPARVDRRVFKLVAKTLRARVEDLLAWPGRPLPAEPAYFRADVHGKPTAPQTPPLPPRGETGEWDEVDQLFRGATT